MPETARLRFVENAATLLGARPTLLVVASLLLGACGATRDAQSVDVTEIWRGTWEGQDSKESGFHTNELLQHDDATVSGMAFLRYDLPKLSNIGVNIEVRVEGNRVTFEMKTADNPH